MIAWFDLETTGLDSQENDILEIAAVITYDNLEILDSISKVIHWSLNEYTKDLIDPVVIEMHIENNLWEECRQSQFNPGADIQYVMVEWFNQYSGEMVFSDTPLAGSTIRFDRNFLKYHMPLLEEMFHYRSIDVSSFKLCQKMWYPDLEFPQPEVKPHRAGPDIVNSIEELRWYREKMFK